MKKCFVFLGLIFMQAAYCQSNEGKDIEPQQVDVVVNDVSNNFIVFSIVDKSNAEEVVLFKEKYKVDIKFETCAVDIMSFKKAKKNNRALALLLTEKYGETWKDEIPYAFVGVSQE